MNIDTGRLATMDEVARMKEEHAARYVPLDAGLSRKAARALAAGRRFPDAEKDKALSRHFKMLRESRRRMQKESRRRNRRA